MKTAVLLSLLVVCAAAQSTGPKMDIYFMAGPSWYKSQGVPGVEVTINGSTGVATQTGYSYRVAGTPKVRLWVDFFPMTFSFPGEASANISGTILFTGYTAAPGIHIETPVHGRLSVYGVAGGGYGDFQYAVVDRNGGPPVLKMIHTTHGVMDFGGGLDVRLTQHFSFRAECRDYVTGRGLSGAPGRNHVVPLAGIAMRL
jgi:hypothetical protein